MNEMVAWSNEPPGSFGQELLTHLLHAGDEVHQVWAQYTANEECGVPLDTEEHRAVRNMLTRLQQDIAEFKDEISGNLRARYGV